MISFKACLGLVDISVCSTQPMKPLKAAATTSQPVLTVAQIETIFFKVPELYEIHKEFYDGLLPRVQQWSHHQRVGDLFQRLVRLFNGHTQSSWQRKGFRTNKLTLSKVQTFLQLCCIWFSLGIGLEQ